jgi:N-acetylneuraminate synthase/N,N'-diacetyllegionaminate synthase
MSFPDDAPYVIAEVGSNHGGSVESAKEHLRSAADAGADAVKFQYYHAENLITRDADPLPGLEEKYDSQFERFAELELSREEWTELVALAERLDVDFAASVFDQSAATFVAENSPFLKIASGDLTHVPLLRTVAGMDVPVVLSTGFATTDEIRRAVDELGRDRLLLLHCVGSYPTAASGANLQLIDRLKAEFGVPVGYSDHTAGIEAATAAVARGTPVVEKHFTLETDAETGDHRLSATPEELSALVEQVETVWRMFGDGDRSEPLDCERAIRDDARRSLATSADIETGDTLTADTLTALRPARGLSPLKFDAVVGKQATRDIPAGEILSRDDIAGL